MRTTPAEKETVLRWDREGFLVTAWTADPAEVRRWRRWQWPVEVAGRDRETKDHQRWQYQRQRQQEADFPAGKTVALWLAAIHQKQDDPRQSHKQNWDNQPDIAI